MVEFNLVIGIEEEVLRIVLNIMKFIIILFGEESYLKEVFLFFVDKKKVGVNGVL